MGTKSGLVVGFGIGYLLGSRAGRERYEQLLARYRRVTASPTFQRATERAKAVAGDQARVAMQTAQKGVQKASSVVRDRRASGDGSGGSTPPEPSAQ